MIIYKCDICKKKVDKVESEILFKGKLDYCEGCKTIATKIRRALVKSIEYYNEEANKQILEAQKNIIRRYTNDT